MIQFYVLCTANTVPGSKEIHTIHVFPQNIQALDTLSKSTRKISHYYQDYMLHPVICHISLFFPLLQTSLSQLHVSQ